MTKKNVIPQDPIGDGVGARKLKVRFSLSRLNMILISCLWKTMKNGQEMSLNHMQVQESLPELDRIAFGDNQILGMHYFDAVYDNVENSFKTILLISRAAVQNHIFMTKFRIAMNHVTDTQTENMVLVFIEDIPDAELPYLVRLYQTGYEEHLMWQESQEYFWYRLSKIMRVNLKTNYMIPP